MATPFTLHGMPMSGATRRVAVIAKERNIPYVLNHVNLMQGEHKQDSYKAHQPFCQIPYISVRRPLPSPPSLMIPRCAHTPR